MAGNINTAPSRGKNSATRFTSLFVGPKKNKSDSADLGQKPSIVNQTIKLAKGQTADALQIVDTDDVLVAKIDVLGVLTAVGGVSPSAAGVLGALGVAKMHYDFAVDGGAQGEIIPVGSPTLPSKAIILGGVINVTTALLAAGGAANISVGTHAGSSATSLKGATAKATYSLNAFLATVPVFTAATMFKMSAAGQMSITVDTNDLTAGVMDVIVVYAVGA